jgi:hypothetical protein
MRYKCEGYELLSFPLAFLNFLRLKFIFSNKTHLGFAVFFANIRFPDFLQYNLVLAEINLVFLSQFLKFDFQSWFLNFVQKISNLAFLIRVCMFFDHYLVQAF